MGKIKEILEGWGNIVLKKDHVEVIAVERRKICDECEHISTKHDSNRPDVHCIVCSCTLAAKTRSMESECPIGKWVKIPINDEK